MVPTTEHPNDSPHGAPADADPRTRLRRTLQDQRLAWATTEAAARAQIALTQRLSAALEQVEPHVLGVFWPMKGEFNPWELARWAQQTLACRLALPHARKQPRQMQFIPWNGEQPTTYDEWGIPSPQGSPVVPDVVIVPCLGFTRTGYRLGYGGGYYDRYLGEHPEICAFGAAWDEGLLTAPAFTPLPHDQPLMAVFTPSHTWGE